MEDLLKCLTEVSVRQQQIVEHIAGRQGQVEEELAALRLAAAQRVPLPDPRIKATQLLPKLTGDDDIELYLQMFETTATRENWDQSEWARLLGPLLTGEAQRAYFSLPTELAESYDNLKKEILGRLGLSPISAAQLFHEWEYKPRHPARAQAAELARLARHWLLEGAPTAGQVAERVTIDRLLRALPPAARRAVGMTNPTTIAELVGSIELAEAAMRRDPGERAPSFPRRVGQERRAPEGTQRTVHRPAAPGPVDEPMPTEDPAPPPRTWMAGCIVHREPPRGAPRAEVKINGRAALALLDSGSSSNHLRCAGAWPVEVGILKELPVPVLLGRDWPGFEQLLLATTQPASQAGSRRDRRNKRHPRRPALLASDSGRDGESPSSNTNVFFDVFQQVAGGGSFAKAQLEDDRLKHCWTQVRVIENQEQQPAPHPLPHFIVKNGLLYCVAQRRGEVKELLVVPKGKVEMIMELAHAHPMAGHLGAANTAQRIRDRFHWPGLDGDVNGSAKPARPVRRPRHEHLPPVHSFRFL
ncbi:hypothetical protein H4Q32_029352 [Labeo rohita]|uniref:SCAN box domain-containing protein n=1 Tax=Labeo rohita TaxID=84645 RepID=A0ABQ8MW04_LABRO|nr:hypothetical protein H4Q32_029352 [Labeo rohita]